MDVNQLRFKQRDRLLKGRVIERFKPLEIAVTCHERMTERSVQVQSPLDIAALLLVANAMSRGQHMQVVTARAQCLDQRLAAHIVSAGMVGRIEISQDENLHDCADERMARLSAVNDGVAFEGSSTSNFRCPFGS
jgi:hypothetical protein